MVVGRVTNEYCRGGNDNDGVDEYEKDERIGEELAIVVSGGFGDDIVLPKVLLCVVRIGIGVAVCRRERDADDGIDKYISGTEPNDVLINETDE